MGLVDAPDATRKLHTNAVSLGGGIAIFLATLFAVLLALAFGGAGARDLQNSVTDLRGILIAASLICLIGLADDRHVLRGRQKLAGQIFAVAVLMYFGVMIKQVSILDWQVDLGLLAIPFTLCWMLGAINSLNLLDGADGFATTVGTIISAAVTFMAVYTEHYAEAMIAASLTGAQLGFLVFNFPPASIFLGDAGSMLIGLIVGSLAIQGSLKGPATVALAAPLAVLAIPFFDSAIAILRRWLTGRSIYATDRGHLHHNLSRRGMGPRAMLLSVALMCACTATGALTGVFMRNELCALASIAAVMIILVVTRVFGFSELILLTTRALAFGNSLLSSTSGHEGRIRQETVRLQGSRNWDELWNALTEFAERHELCDVRLDLNAAWLHEGFYAKWHRSQASAVEVWMTRLPVIANGRTLGRLEIVGPTTKKSVYELLSLFAELLQDLEPQILGLAKELPHDPLLDEEPISQETVLISPNAAKETVF